MSISDLRLCKLLFASRSWLQRQLTSLMSSLMYVVVDIQDRQELSVMESPEHSLRLTLITDRFLNLQVT